MKYGADYLQYAIRSIIDHIDEYHVLYATQPSHGHASDAVCPDTEAELHEIAWQAAGSKLKFHYGNWRYEGEQRNSILDYAPDADVILVLDSDEIWGEGLAEAAIDVTTSGNFRMWRLPIIHYWRSFNKCVLHDPAFPIRVLCPHKHPVQGTIDTSTCTFETGDNQLKINHMGYATTPAIMAYKWQIHGHKDELRKDVNWFQDVFMANRQYDTHPVGSEFWQPEDVNPLDYMPEWMQSHPFYGKDVIE